jgi:short-subunit dehydrogenase
MQERTVLITGASAGIGRELSKVFAREGHDLVLVARSSDKLRELASSLSDRYGVEAVPLAYDLSRPDAPEALFAALEKLGIQIDVLLNNAGVLSDGNFVNTGWSRYLELLQLNVMAPAALSHLFLPPMLERGHGKIMNVASIAAFQPLPRLALYSASKAFLLHFTEALSEELRGSGVTATALCPGFTETDMLSDRQPGWPPPFAVGRAEEVALEGYRACMSGVPVHVNGAANQFLTQMVRLQPRWLVRALTGMAARAYR